ncbi:MAG: PilZ domain-containing protein [Thermoanaerobaculia bacterium]
MSLEIRTPGVGGELVLEFGSVREFLEHCSSRLSEEGMFVESEALEELGTEVEFQVGVSGGFRLFSGRGEVAWRRPAGLAGEPAGVAIRFLDLDKPSRRLLYRVAESYRREGATLFDLDRAPAPSAEISPGEVPTFDEPPATAEPIDEDLKRTEVISLDSLAPLEEVTPVDRVGVEEDEAVVEEPAMISESMEQPSEPPAPIEPSETEVPAAAGDQQVPQRTIEDLLTSSHLYEPGGPSLAAAEGSEDFERQLLETLPEAVPPAELGQEALAQQEVALDAQAAAEEGAFAAFAEETPRRARGLFLAVAILGLLAGAGAFHFRGPLLSLIGGSREPGEEIAAPPDSPPAAQTPVGEGTDALPEREAGLETDSEPGAAASSAEGRLTAIVSIDWREEGGETVLVLVGDGPFRVKDYPSLRFTGSDPRLLLKIPGVNRSLEPDRLTIGSAHLRRVRTGLHLEPDGTVLHVVVDLTSDQVKLQRIEARGRELHLVFSDS